MDNKRLRRLRTKEIIRDHHISNQEDLLKLLRNEGFNLTQATLSRDLKKMNISKTTDTDKSHRYSIVEDKNLKPLASSHSFISLDFSGNLAIIKTLPGYASPMAVLMDNNPSPLIKGTIAGRDTIFIALSNTSNNHDEFKVYLNKMLYSEIDEF